MCCFNNLRSLLVYLLTLMLVQGFYTNEIGKFVLGIIKCFLTPSVNGYGLIKRNHLSNEKALKMPKTNWLKNP